MNKLAPCDHDECGLTECRKGLDDAACSPSCSDTPRTNAFCNSLKRMGNWERWQKTASFAADIERENAKLRESLIPFAQIGDIANDPDCTIWRRAVAAGDVRRARKIVLENSVLNL
jgi:hypothetical protein